MALRSAAPATSPLRISGLKREARGPVSRISASFLLAGDVSEVWFDVSTAMPEPEYDAFVPIALLPAMRYGCDICVDGQVSAQLLSALPQIQDVLLSWLPELKRVKVEAAPRTSPGRADRRVASFFSGGVDSYFTLLKHFDEITDLVVLRGFDIFLNDQALWDSVAPAIHASAARAGKRLIEIHTNLRDFCDPHADWTFYHGAALAGVAILLSSHFSKVYIAASHSYAQLFPWGSHPLLDPMWSTETVQIVHDGAEASRMDKLRRLATSDLALRALRVCWENLDGRFNCGRCEKCLRTMAGLEVFGALERCGSFPPLDLQALANLPLPDENSRTFMVEVLEAARQEGCGGPLLAALDDCVNGRRQRDRRRSAHAALDRLIDAASPLRTVGASLTIGTRRSAAQ